MVTPVITPLEKRQVSETIALLNKVRKTDSEQIMLRHLQEAFVKIRNLHRYRNEV